MSDSASKTPPQPQVIFTMSDQPRAKEVIDKMRGHFPQEGVSRIRVFDGLESLSAVCAELRIPMSCTVALFDEKGRGRFSHSHRQMPTSLRPPEWAREIDWRVALHEIMGGPPSSAVFIGSMVRDAAIQIYTAYTRNYEQHARQMLRLDRPPVVTRPPERRQGPSSIRAIGMRGN